MKKSACKYRVLKEVCYRSTAGKRCARKTWMQVSCHRTAAAAKRKAPRLKAAKVRVVGPAGRVVLSCKDRVCTTKKKRTKR